HRYDTAWFVGRPLEPNGSEIVGPFEVRGRDGGDLPSIAIEQRQLVREPAIHGDGIRVGDREKSTPALHSKTVFPEAKSAQIPSTSRRSLGYARTWNSSSVDATCPVAVRGRTT